jgi:hypothetical protein
VGGIYLVGNESVVSCGEHCNETLGFIKVLVTHYFFYLQAYLLLQLLM